MGPMRFVGVRLGRCGWMPGHCDRQEERFLFLFEYVEQREPIAPADSVPVPRAVQTVEEFAICSVCMPVFMYGWEEHLKQSLTVPPA